MEPLSVLLGAAGFVLGLAADRFATRWPEHDDEHPPGRAVDWRTGLTALVGAIGFGLLPLRFGHDPLVMLVFGAWLVTLIVGLATDLDQRILPNWLTLPVIPVALAYALSGANPLVGSDVALTVIVAAAIPVVLFLPSIPFGAGAFGLGDVKLLLGVGLLVGPERALGTVVFALLLAGLVLVVLLAAKRISRRTYVPFGPFFIIGALWAALIR
jgi:leader peptidase (prepilin peptidase)/N-methyltransferase